MTYIFFTPKGNVEVSDYVFSVIKRRAEGRITYTQYYNIISKSKSVRQFCKENKVPIKSVAQWLITAYRQYKYERVKTICWNKVLATITFVYEKTGRELEGRLLIDAPCKIYNDKSFRNMCIDAIEYFFELAGYSIELITESERYEGFERVKTFKQVEDMTPEFYIEIYDGNYGRYPFHAKGVLPKMYWNDYRNAIITMMDEMERNIVYEWRYESEI